MPDPFTTVRSRVVPLAVDNIDTDQIIPARFLKGVERRGMAAGLFANWRDDPGFVLNRRELDGAEILLTGENFGCGSSREHAPWALVEHGFRVVVSARFADIFYGNALKNGLLPVVLPEAVCRELLARAEAPGGLVLEVDLAEQVVRDGIDGAWRFEIDGFAKRCLEGGVDQLGFLLGQLPAIERWEAGREPAVDTLGPASALDGEAQP